jgi:hypothetical protein
VPPWPVDRPAAHRASLLGDTSTEAARSAKLSTVADHRDVPGAIVPSVLFAHAGYTRTRIRPSPFGKGSRALPITAPKPRRKSVTFMA